MANRGPSSGGLQNSTPASIVAGNNVTYTFATLPPATNFAPGFTAITSDEGLCVVSATFTWEIVGSGGGVAIEAGTNSLSSGTVSFANSNGVSFGMDTAGVITATVTPGAAAGIGAIQLPNTTYTSGTVNFINSNGLSFGSTTGGGVTASYNSTQFAGVGTTFAGTNISGSITQNSAGINLALSGPTESGIGLSAAGSSQTAGNLVLSNSNGLSFGMNGSTITGSYNSTQFAGTGTTFAGTNVSASATLNSAGLNLALSAGAGGGGGIAASLGGNTSGALALVSSGTLFLAGGNNVTLSQNGNSVTISANTVAAANLSVSAGTTTGAFGGLTFSNSNNISYGLNNGTITGSVNAPGLGTTFAGANVSGSMTLNTAGLNLSLSGPAESGVALSAAGSSQSQGTMVFSNSNGLSFGMNGSTVTASYNSTQFAGTGTTFSGTNISGSITHNSLGINLALSAGAGGGATTGGLYAAGNTTGQSSSSTFPNSSLNFSLAGILSGGWSSNSFIISAPGTTGLTQLSAGFSTGGNTAGTSGLASAQLVLAGGANITLSGSTNGGSMTVSIAGGAGGGGGVDVTLGGNTSGALALVSTGTLFLAGGNNITLSQNGNSVTVSGANAGGAQTGISGLVVSNTTYTSGTVTFQNANGISFGSSGANGISASYTVPSQISTIGLYALGNTTQNSSTTLNQSALSFNALGAMTMGYSNSSIQVSAPATSSISGTGQVSISVNGSTISIGVPSALTLSGYDPYPGPIVFEQIGQNAIAFDPTVFANPVQFDRVVLPFYFTGTTAGIGTISLSASVGIYTQNGLSLSLLNSTSASLSVPISATIGNYSLYSGLRNFSFGSTNTLNAGQYWFGFGSSTASAGVLAGAFSNACQGAINTNATNNFNGFFGVTVGATNQYSLGQGYYSVSSAAMPASVAFSQINGTSPIGFTPQIIMFGSSTA